MIIRIKCLIYVDHILGIDIMSGLNNTYAISIYRNDVRVVNDIPIEILCIQYSLRIHEPVRVCNEPMRA